jgi:hypothetical protein
MASSLHDLGLDSTALDRSESTPLGDLTPRAIRGGAAYEHFVVTGRMPSPERFTPGRTVSVVFGTTESAPGEFLRKAHVVLGLVGSAIALASAARGHDTSLAAGSAAVLGPASEGRTVVLRLNPFNTWTCWKCLGVYNKITVKVCPRCNVSQEGRQLGR